MGESKNEAAVQRGKLSHTLIINGTLPGLNEYVNAERSNRYKAAAMKHQVESVVIACAKKYLRGVKYERPVVMEYRWYEPNKRRDKDNVVFAKKFIQDGLVKAGVLHGDGWKWIERFNDDVQEDKNNPRVEVTISEV